VTRTLIAGFGNVLRGDDGFGVEVIRQLEAAPLPPGVTLMEIGTAWLRSCSLRTSTSSSSMR
jgi:hydrogenase maturation protease